MDQDTLKQFVTYLQTLKNDYITVQTSENNLKEQNTKILSDYKQAINIINKFSEEKDLMVSKIKEIEKFKKEFIDLYKQREDEINSMNEIKNKELLVNLENLKKENELLKKENPQASLDTEKDKTLEQQSLVINKLHEENTLMKEYIAELEKKNSNVENKEEKVDNEEFEKIVEQIEIYKKDVELLTEENNELSKKIGINLNDE